MSKKTRLVVRPRIERLDDRCLLTAVTPSLLTSAYSINAISFSNGSVKGTGEGQTIAIVDAYNDTTINADLTAFETKYGLPKLASTSSPASNSATSTAVGSFSVINLAGTATNSGWDTETALDVEWAHAAAPGANIVLVEAASSNTLDLLAAVNQAKSIPSVSVISMSWGSSEFSGETKYDAVFTTPSGHKGITFVASSGDSGAGAQWPSSSPNVVSVGGTSLTVNSSGARSNEMAWTGSGGGVSQYETEPTFQKSVQSTGHRTTPDVAMNADPNTGVIEISGGKSYQVGGTSLSSPLFGALVAITNQGLTIAGKGTLNGATQLLPSLYAAPSANFQDITSGANGRATTGYDYATGLGSPNGKSLVQYLDPASVPTTTTPTTTSPTTSPTTAPKSTTPTTTSSTTTPTTPPSTFKLPVWWFYNGGTKSNVAVKAVTLAGTTSDKPFWL